MWGCAYAKTDLERCFSPSTMKDTTEFFIYMVPQEVKSHGQKTEQWFPGDGERGGWVQNYLMDNVSVLHHENSTGD